MVGGMELPRFPTRLRCVSSALLGGVCAVALSGAATAQKVSTTADGAFRVAMHLVEKGAYGEAEQILQTLAAAPPEAVDQRLVDRISAKIAFEKGDVQEAIRLLDAVLAYDPNDWDARYDLATILALDRRDRAAARQLRIIITRSDVPALIDRARRDLRGIEERRLVEMQFRATAAPSTNVNAATSARTIEYNLGNTVLDLDLDERARQTSGVGANWVLGTTIRPRLSRRKGRTVRGHFMVRGQLADYPNADFDQGSVTLEAGFRRNNPAPGGMGVFVTSMYDRAYFGAAPYAERVGVRAAVSRSLGKRYTVSTEISAQHAAYDDRATRDGPVVGVSMRGTMVPVPWARAGLSVAVSREDTAASPLANTRYTVGPSLSLLGPWKTRLGVFPSVSFRQFDEQRFGELELREDWTYDIATQVGKSDWVLNGFYPSLLYRFTDNKSTVALYDYKRHTMDISFSRSF